MPERIANHLWKLAMSQDQRRPEPTPPPPATSSVLKQLLGVFVGGAMSILWGYTALQIGWSREDQKAAVAKQEAAAKALDARLGDMQAAIGDNRYKTDQTVKDTATNAGQIAQLADRLAAGQSQRIENDRIFDGKLARLDNRLSVMETKIDLLLREARREGSVPFGQRQMGPSLGDRLMPIPASMALSPIVTAVNRT